VGRSPTIYEQVAATIVTVFTASVRCAAPAVPTALDVLDDERADSESGVVVDVLADELAAGAPVTDTFLPMFFSRSGELPVRRHVAFDADCELLDVVEEDVLLLLGGLAGGLAGGLLGLGLVLELLLELVLAIALFSMKLPLASFARHPVSVMSRESPLRAAALLCD
jgi:hypothetical protein